MAELTFKSAGVSTREIDLTGPANVSPSGTPAAVVGTAKQGRAFVPITVGNFADFVTEFGTTDGETFGPMAIRQWLRNAGSATYVRLLGCGDGLKRNSNGDVTRGGFKVGNRQPQANGNIGNNAYAGVAAAATPGLLGRTSFLGLCMEETNSSGIFTGAGLQSLQPILRGVIMAPSGVLPALSASRASATAKFSGNN